MEAITVHYKLSEQEYLDAARLILFPRPAEGKLRAATVCVLFPTAITLLALGAGFALIPALVLAAACLPLLVYLYFFQFTILARRCYKGDRKLREKMTVTFTDEHITVQSKLIESKQSWKLYTDVLEGEKCYVLIYGKDIRMGTMLPKRAFQSKKQHLAFRELIGAQFEKTLPVQQIGDGDAAQNEPGEYQPANYEPPDWR